MLWNVTETVRFLKYVQYFSSFEKKTFHEKKCLVKTEMVETLHYNTYSTIITFRNFFHLNCELFLQKYPKISI